VQADEAHDSRHRPTEGGGVRLPVRHRQDHPRRVWVVAGRRQLPAGHQLL
jgi:hypothetical protein